MPNACQTVYLICGDQLEIAQIQGMLDVFVLVLFYLGVTYEHSVNIIKCNLIIIMDIVVPKNILGPWLKLFDIKGQCGLP